MISPDFESIGFNRGAPALVQRISKAFPYLNVSLSDSVVSISHRRKHWYSDNPSWPSFEIYLNSATNPEIQKAPFVCIPIFWFFAVLLIAVVKQVADLKSIIAMSVFAVIPSIHFGYRYHQTKCLVENRNTVGQRLGNWLARYVEGK